MTRLDITPAATAEEAEAIRRALETAGLIRPEPPAREPSDS